MAIDIPFTYALWALPLALPFSVSLSIIYPFSLFIPLYTYLYTIYGYFPAVFFLISSFMLSIISKPPIPPIFRPWKVQISRPTFYFRPKLVFYTSWVLTRRCAAQVTFKSTWKLIPRLLLVLEKIFESGVEVHRIKTQGPLKNSNKTIVLIRKDNMQPFSANFSHVWVEFSKTVTPQSLTFHFPPRGVDLRNKYHMNFHINLCE